MANIVLRRETMNPENNDAKQQAAPAGRKKKVGKMILAILGLIVCLIIVMVIVISNADAKRDMIMRLEYCAHPVIDARYGMYDYTEVMKDKRDRISQLSQSGKFSKVLLEELDELNESGDFERFVSLIEALDYAKYQEESIKEMLAEAYQAKEDELFRDADSILENKSAIGALIRMEYYFDGRQAVIDHLKGDIHTVITENGKGGYYDTLHGEYQSSSGKGDPLGLGSGVGTYSTTESYSFYGDFLAKRSTKYWYGTEKSDKNNSSITSWEFRGETISNKEFRSIHEKGIYDVVSQNPSYYIESSTGEHLILVFTEDNLTALIDDEVFLAYHDDKASRQYIAFWK